MLHWIKKFAAKRCRKFKQKHKCGDNVIEEVDSDSLNHTYEEIPDVIPATWRGMRSETVPSLFFTTTTDQYFTSHMDKENSAMSLAESFSFDQSYEKPQHCMGYILDIDQPDFKVDNFKFCTEHDLTEVIDTVECNRDRLSCVRVSCHHNHSSIINKVPRAEESKSNRGDNCDEDLPYYSMLEPSWENFCDDIVSSLLLKTSTFEQLDNRGQRDYSHISFNSSKRNSLLGDLIQRNYDKVY